MNGLRLVEVVNEIDRVERRLLALRGEARKLLGDSGEATVTTTKRGSLSAAQRRKLSQAMKQRWAAIKSQTQATSQESTNAKSRSGTLSDAQRRKISLAMKRKWAERRKEQQARPR
jgi:hypothetical protein